MRAAVIGASGFVGSEVCRALEAEGHEVVRIRAPRLREAATTDDLTSVTDAYAAEIALLAESFTGCAAAVNCAGDPDASSNDLEALRRANGHLAAVFAEAARRAGVPRSVHVSSAVVQGRRPVLDTSLEYEPFSAYARSKILGEKLFLDSKVTGGVVYRPPSVHAPNRRVTRMTARIARSGLSSVAAPADAPTPQALLENVGRAVAHLATCEPTPPSVVIHPWEGLTTGSLLTTLGGRPPRPIPRPIARAITEFGRIAGKATPRVAANARRIEMIWFGQGQADSWLTDQGWRPRDGWGDLVDPPGSAGPSVLIATSVASMIDQFNRTNIQLLLDEGCTVHVATNFGGGTTTSPERTETLKRDLTDLGVVAHDVPFARSPFGRANLRALGAMRRIIGSQQFSVIHCQSPTGGAVTRVARILARSRAYTIYTAHGFHFFHGAPVKNWLTYYPIEALLSLVTDLLVTINEEDAATARRLVPARAHAHVHGVGVDLERFAAPSAAERDRLRDELGLSDNRVAICVAELNDNKNQVALIRAMPEVVERVPGALLLLVGRGPNDAEYRALIHQLGIADHVRLLGFRDDVPRLMRAADCATLVSHREGLPVNVMEAMATGLPLVVSDCRGSRELVEDGISGFIVAPDDVSQVADRLATVLKDCDARSTLGSTGRRRVTRYALTSVREEMRSLYRRGLAGRRSRAVQPASGSPSVPE